MSKKPYELPEGCELGLAIRPEGDMKSTGHWDYWHLKAHPVCIDRNKSTEDSEAGALTWGYSLDNLDNLEVYSQGNCDAEEEKRYLYAWEVGYNNGGLVNHDRAKRMVAVLGLIKRRLDKMDNDAGYCRSFGQYVGRVARALGVKWILFAPRDGQQAWNNGYRWHAQSVGRGVNQIEHLEHEYKHAISGMAVV
jgi:hypothetical protein